MLIRGTHAGAATEARGLSGGRAFTLIELILVMTILTIAISITAPALANFFRGRSFDSEARRLLAMTRQGQSRAVAEGVPVELWVDAANSTVGLEAEPSYEPQDGKAVEITLDSNVAIEAVNADATASLVTAASTPLAGTSGAGTAQVLSRHPDLPRIRFLPDGTIAPTSPAMLRLTSRDGFRLCVALTRNHLSYEIRPDTN